MNFLFMRHQNAFFRRCIFYLLLSFISLKIFAQPTISSFSPASGPAGTTVTITGTNFSTTPANNIVFFGAVKGNITAATSSSLTVIVPAGTTYQPITVTVNGLTGYSAQPFVVTFPGGVLTTASFEFAAAADNVTGLETDDLSITDMDGDGKPDLIVVDKLNGFFAFYKNTSTGSAISFAPRTNYQSGNRPQRFVVGDIDGDGKPDVAVANSNDNNVSVFRNTTAGGIISFALKTNYSIDANSLGICLADFDSDGKPDIATISTDLDGTVTILRNTSTTGSVSFAPKTSFAAGGILSAVSAADINNDGKPDLVVTNLALNIFAVLKNTSTTGSISFVAGTSSPTGSFPDRVTVGDLDKDGKSDVIVSYFNSTFISVFRNTSSGSAMSFSGTINHPAGSAPNGSIITDFDGDSNLDVAEMNIFESISFYKNNSTSGNISLASKIDIPISGSTKIASCDLNGDGKPEIAILAGVLRVLIFENKTTKPQITSFTPASGGSGATVTITGANFSGTTAVNFGGSPAASFTVVNSTTITAVVGSGASGNISVAAPHGTGARGTFTYYPTPVITSFTPTSAGTSGTVTITGTSFTAATAVSFGGIPASSFTVVDANTIIAVVGNGASGNVSVTTPGGTGSLAGFIYTGPTITSFSPMSSGSGTTITITGTNFLGAYAVSFGGVAAASFTVVNPTTITAVVANGASGNVVVSNAFGTATSPGYVYTGPGVFSFSPTSGNAGTVITITGNNFIGTTAVNFGGTNASSFTVVNSTTITATVGLGTTGNVSVTTPLGTATMPGFTYTGPPIINSFTPLSAGPGTTITISGAHFTGTTAVSFGGTAATSFTVVNPTTITAVVAAGTSGNVSVTTINGTVSIPGFVFIPIPKITSFTPLQGPIGTSVTITGENFSTVPGNNTVYFGATKAIVTASTSATLTVSVPTGATYEQISVLVNGLTAYSLQPFIVTFNNNGIKSFGAASFAPRFDIDMGIGLSSSGISDIDGDGKPDITENNYNAHGFSVLRNTSVSGNLSFEPKVTFSDIDAQGQGIFIKDFDGDSKPDVITSGGSNVKISRNTSSVGMVSFAPMLQILPGLGAYYCYGEDVDLDGKPDVITANHYAESISILRNTSTTGSIAFAPRINISVPGGYPERIMVRDIDGDNKPDILMSMINPDQVVVYRNTSSVGNISFAPGVNFPTGQTPFGFSAGDLDGDGKVDLVTGNYSSANSSIFKNTSTPGVISFVASTFNCNVGGTENIILADINGDGKPDMVIVDGAFLNLFNNTSTPGDISFETKVPYLMASSPRNAAVGDLDGDGRPDMASHSNSNGLFTSIYRNKVGDYGITSFSPASASTGGVITITGINLTGSTAVSFGGVAASSFTMVNATTITAVVGAGASGNVSVTTAGGESGLRGFTYITPLSITSFTPTSGASGTSVTITGTNFIGTTAVSFGGIAASSFTVVNATTITAIVASGATGDVKVTTPSGTATKSGFTFITPSVPSITSFTPISSITGATITITGINFTGATAVSFGGIAASSFTVVNATTITAVVGGGATGNISVTTASGTATKSGFIFTINPLPIITSFTPVAGNTGTLVTILGSNFTGTTAVSFGGAAASSFTVVNSNIINAVVANGASGSVSVTTANGVITKPGFTFISSVTQPLITSFTPTSGANGTIITITGINFTGATAVSFGGVAAHSFLVVNATTIKAIIENGASGDVSIVTPNGTASLAGFVYTGVVSGGLTVSPNPANDFIVVLHPPSVTNAFLRLIDLTGKVVRIKAIIQNSNSTSMSVKGLTTGIYKLMWTDGIGSMGKTIMITQ